MRVAPDGSRVYFVARGDLLAVAQQQQLEREGRPVPRVGADNLYVYDSTTETNNFVAELCSGPEASGLVDDPRCPSPTETDVCL